jgi:hypothetical protein
MAEITETAIEVVKWIKRYASSQCRRSGAPRALAASLIKKT